MNAELKSKENNRAKFTTKVDYKDFDAKISEIYRKNKHYFTVPGFRKGKAPRKIIELNYGESIFYEDAINDMIPSVFEQAVEELELNAVGQPFVDVEEIIKGEDIVLNFEVDIKPIPEIGDYSDLNADIPKLEITDELIQSRINRDLEENVRLVEKDGEAESGDIVNIDYLGEIDGTPFEGGKDEGHDLVLGSNSFIPGFEDQLIGTKKDDKVDVKVTFPEDYHAKELEGKNAVFHVTVNSVKGKDYPEFDDEFVKDISEFDTVDDYKDSIKEELTKERDNTLKMEKQNRAVKALIEVSEVEVPDSMVDQRVNEELHQFEHSLTGAGLTLEQYAQFSGMTLEDLKAQIRPVAEEKVIGDLVLEKFVELEDIDATEEEMDEEINDLAKAYGREDVDKLKEEIESFGTMDIVRAGVQRRKAIDKLVEMTSFHEVEPEELETEENQTEEEEEENTEE